MDMSNAHDIWITLWFLANLLTGLAYYHIPIELMIVMRRAKIGALNYIGWTFVVFILACGTHHLVMIRNAHMHPIDGPQISADVVMAIVSVSASWILHKIRSQIVTSLRKLAAI